MKLFVQSNLNVIKNLPVTLCITFSIVMITLFAGSGKAQEQTSVEPLVECVIDFGNGYYTAVFNYNNPNTSPVLAQSADVNFLTPEIPDATLPRILRPRVRPGVPNVLFEVPFSGESLTWTLFDQSVTASLDSPACDIENTIPVHINAENTLQTITGFGGAFVFQYSKTMDRGLVDMIAPINFETLKPTHMRFDMQLDFFEPINDNDDPNSLNMDAFEVNDRIQANLDYMQMAQEADIVRHISVWIAPDWMVENPEDGRNRILMADMYDEFVESMVGYLIYARDEYGVTLDTISLNEPDYGIYQDFTPQQQADIIKRASTRFEEEGLPTRWVMGETSGISGAVEYAEQVWATDGIPELIDVWAYHSWDAASGDAAMRRNAEWASDIDREVWITEMGFDPEIYVDPTVFPTFNFALRTAQIYSRMYKLSGMNVPFYWQMIDDFRVIAPDGETFFPSYYLLYGLRYTIPIGAQVIETSDDVGSVFSFAVQSETGETTLVLLNTSPERQALRLTGLPEGDYQHLRLSANEMLEPAQNITADGSELSFFLMGNSVNWITTVDIDLEAMP